MRRGEREIEGKKEDEIQLMSVCQIISEGSMTIISYVVKLGSTGANVERGGGKKKTRSPRPSGGFGGALSVI